jgi:hypothetical protein
MGEAVMGTLWTPKPFFEATVWTWPNRVEAQVRCNKCGDQFNVRLKGHTKDLTESQIKTRLFNVSGERHSCSEAGLVSDRIANMEINRMVNKYHDKKHELVKYGVIDKNQTIFDKPKGHA